MTRAELIQAVALRMDEITPSSELTIPVDGLTGTDSNPLYALIDGIADDCAVELYSVAPYWRLPQTAFNAATEIIIEAISSETGSRKVIRLKLNDSFLRVAEINCPDFFRPITEVVPEQSPEGRRQHTPFLMGREAKPVGVLSYGLWNSSPCREIDCYSIGASSLTQAADVTASYIPKPASAESVPDILQPALQWLAAARTFGARGDANHAAICQQNAQNLIV